MKIHHIISALALAGTVAFGFSSCISDDSELGSNNLPSLQIAGAGATEMPKYNIYLGNECVIKPQITYDGGNESELKYSWKIGSYANGMKGELTEVSTDSELHYNFDKGGSYYVHLTVTDGKVGKVVEYQVNVNRTFEEGYMLTSTDADGKGNLVFVKIMTPEEIAAGQEPVIMEHSMEKMNSNVSENGLINAILCKLQLGYNEYLTRLCVATEKSCYILDPNNMTVISQLNFDDLIPGFKATDFIPDSYAPYAYDAEKKKFAHIELTYLFPYSKESFTNCHPEKFIISKYSSWGNEALWTFYLNYTDNKVIIYSPYAAYFGYNTDFPDTENFFDGHSIITAFYGDSPNANYITPSYFLTRNNQNGDITLWTDAEDSYFYKQENLTTQAFTPTANTAVPEKGTTFVVSPKQQRYFYPLNNSVYVLLPKSDFALPEKSQYAIHFGADEEVTFLDVNFTTDELYVATYNKTSKRGSFYIYDCKDVRTDNGANVKPKAEYRHCAGKISNIIYKPSVQ